MSSTRAGANRFLRLLHYVRRYTPAAIVAVFMAAGVGLFDGFRVMLVGPVFDNVLHPGVAPHKQISLVPPQFGSFHLHLTLQQFVPSGLHNAWNMVAYALVLSTLLKGICSYAGAYLASYAGFGTITDLRNDLYEVILRRSVSFFQKHTTGTLLSALVTDIERVQLAMSTVLAGFLQQLFTLVAMTGLVIVVGGKLAWILVLFIPLVYVSMRRIGRGVRKSTRKGQDKLAEIQNILHETITGNRIVKAFNMESWELVRFRAAARRLLRANMRTVTAQSVSSPLMDLIGAVAIALLLKVGHIAINHHQMKPGQFMVLIVALFKLYDPVRRFAVYYNSFQQAVGSSQAIFNFIDDEEHVVEKPDAVALTQFRKSIVLDHVGFNYSDEEGVKEALKDVDLTIRRGEVVALVGPSGAGKSTLVSLIPRFFDVTSGRVLIDGHDLRDVTLASLRHQIATVTQETILFNDTVRNNIAYGQPDVPFSKVEEAAKAALAHDFIEQMPDGYNTVIGEKGFRLSGGERQRLAIARAILKNAPILILDEATSALDAESESLVQAALANLMQDRTSIVIAHRLSTVRRADRIAVIEAGHITAIGSHEELLLSSPTYQKLYKLQFMNIEPANTPHLPLSEAVE
jgi:ATP-binding cassette, subfamily B, bacterial MsbA